MGGSWVFSSLKLEPISPLHIRCMSRALKLQLNMPLLFKAAREAVAEERVQPVRPERIPKSCMSRSWVYHGPAGEWTLLLENGKWYYCAGGTRQVLNTAALARERQFYKLGRWCDIPPFIDWISHGITDCMYSDPDPFVSHAEHLGPSS